MGRKQQNNSAISAVQSLQAQAPVATKQQPRTSNRPHTASKQIHAPGPTSSRRDDLLSREFGTMESFAMDLFSGPAMRPYQCARPNIPPARPSSRTSSKHQSAPAASTSRSSTSKNESRGKIAAKTRKQGKSGVQRGLVVGSYSLWMKKQMRKWRPSTNKGFTIIEEARRWANAAESQQMRSSSGIPYIPRPVSSLSTSRNTRRAMKTKPKPPPSEMATLRAEVTLLRRRVTRLERQMGAFAEVVVSGVGVIVAVLGEINSVHRSTSSIRPVGGRPLLESSQAVTRRIATGQTPSPKPPTRTAKAVPPRGWNDFSDVVDLRPLFESKQQRPQSGGSKAVPMPSSASSSSSKRPQSAGGKKNKNVRRADQ
ncbi:hypothetical protein M427DRAFT_46189 [Gonapodya prolifera JEL478]|uniref:Uncharacterized protein n=1 Tax=Gonapodya prolifera (strain JEL478) TaxID=1344416 RepID=A0A139A7M4_GONPJ|nr:hypothetical protein M427DRAFT_46189 [Gonapodya prolifera JEL478]|eukprot:KXS12780.1 hypothetical protein M427DRAFT_46189 [Gonapodya prolifera JEL478]